MRGHIWALAGLAMVQPVQAQAQLFVDLFAGHASPERRRAQVRTDEVRIDDRIMPADVRIGIDGIKPDSATFFGGRIGYWRGVAGFAIDVATLDPDIRAQTIRANSNTRFDETLFGERVTIDPGDSVSVNLPRITVPTTVTAAALAMVRVPTGTLRPYAFAGPVYLVTDTDVSGDWGLRAGAGLRIALNRTIGVFGEYRYTRVNATAPAGRVGGSARDVEASGLIDVDLRLRNHSAAGGLSFLF